MLPSSEYLKFGMASMSFGSWYAQTTSFFLVSGFGSGAYSAKLFAGTKQRFSGLSHMRQCGDVVVRMFVTGGHGDFGGGGMPQRMSVISVPLSVLRITGAG